ncbi:MAG: ATP-binding protein [Saprospiraceae bacterium]|nr:ATP-binding protein [Saprospiraceae bacterium]
MSTENQPHEALQRELIQIAEQGIQSDVQHLKEDFCAQFADPFEFIREYVVNAYDAQATQCIIHGRESREDITITIQDNGHGMNKEGAVNFFTLYRSRKFGDPLKTVGRFGIGKLSVAAIPGQNTFLMKTSTGSDCWEARAGSLLSNDPIDLFQIRPIPPAGTTFEITFQKKDSLAQVMKKLEHLLYQYVRYLDMEILIYQPLGENEEEMMQVPVLVQDDWYRRRKYSQRYQVTIDGDAYDIIMELKPVAGHEIYQNQVYITNKYNLISYDLKQPFALPYLHIRVDSNAFTLPFGRHCLANEGSLRPVTHHIRERLLPQFFKYIVQQLNNRKVMRQDHYYTWTQEMAITLLQYIPGLDYPWSKLAVFKVHPDLTLSLQKLEKWVVKSGKIFVAEKEAVGVDYNMFDGPVILQDQLGRGFAFLTSYFQSNLINLSLNDVVIEAPSSLSLSLSDEELAFQHQIGFHEDLSMLDRIEEMDDEDAGILEVRRVFSPTDEDLFDFHELSDSRSAFERLDWRVNYLVGKDGKSPCTTHKFILVQDEVVLNLHHTEIRELVKLAKTAPKLAGHWAVALCLTENTKILNYLSADARENLLMLDAMARINNPDEAAHPGSRSGTSAGRKRFRRLLDDSDIDFSLN